MKILLLLFEFLSSIIVKSLLVSLPFKGLVAFHVTELEYCRFCFHRQCSQSSRDAAGFRRSATDFNCNAETASPKLVPFLAFAKNLFNCVTVV